MKKKAELKIYGMVQGVFFRSYTQRKARELYLAGWVRNEPDGSVTIVAEGEEENLKELIGWAQNGGTEYAKVDKVDVKWSDASNKFDDFIVK